LSLGAKIAVSVMRGIKKTGLIKGPSADLGAALRRARDGLYESCVQIVKETNGPTVSMSNNHVKIQFRSVDGGFYCIVPLFNILLP
jgi:hypothetical protein